MRGLAAIVLKDFRRLRGWLLLWLGLNALLVLAILVPHLVLPARWLVGAVDNLFYVAALPLGTVALAFALVRDDLPFDAGAFWVARPVAGWMLAAAKLIEVVLALWLVPLLAGWVLWEKLGFTAEEMIGSAWMTLGFQMVVSLAVFPFALLGERRRPQLAWLCLLLGVVGLTLVNARLTGMVNNGFNHLPLGLSESRFDIVSLLACLTLVASAAAAYGMRRSGRTFSILGGGAVCVACCAFVWPWNFERSRLRIAERSTVETTTFSPLGPVDVHPNDTPAWGRLHGTLELANGGSLDVWGGGGLVNGTWTCGDRTVPVEGKFALEGRQDLAAALVDGKVAPPYSAAIGLDVFALDPHGAGLPMPGKSGGDSNAGIRLAGTLLFRTLVADPVVREPLGGGAEDKVRPWRIRIDEGNPWFASGGSRSLVIRAIAPVSHSPRTEFLLVNKPDGRVATANYLKSDVIVYGVVFKRCTFSLPPESALRPESRSQPRAALPYELAVVTFHRSPLLALPISVNVAIAKP